VPDRKAKIRETTDWSSIADWYDQLVGETGSEYHREVVLPGVLRLLAPQAGQHILDVASGQGVLARLLAAKGAHVTALDASRELVQLARDRLKAASPETQIDFRVADARELDFLPEGQFDSAACVLAIQNIHPIQPVFTGISRALKPNGKFVLAMMHPHFRGHKETSWGWDNEQKIQYRRVDRYLLPRKSPITAHPGTKTGEYTWSFHKPLEQYVRSLRNAGMLVDALEEWPSHKTSTSGPRAAAENNARKEIPLFLAIRAVKVPLVD
jgi:ubiquinone/menaquinone biosynthesis C-methylase UbiE